jgi:flagellar hook protein FlgE
VSVSVYDGLGNAHDLRLTFSHTGAGTWSWTAECETAPVTSAGEGLVTFNEDGTLASFTYPDGGSGLTLSPENGASFEVTINAGETDGLEGLSGFASSSNVLALRHDGYEAGELLNISVDSTGTVNGSFSNGVTRALARIAIASFSNPSALLRTGGNLFVQSPNSGSHAIGYAGADSPSLIVAGALEGSNVDFTQEFSNMIITQRGFQANARVITTADEMLSELANLRR